jgi:mannonate dehydratase
MQITNVKCILTAPANIGLAVVKVETSESGLYGVGCATFTQRLLPVRSAIEDYLKPLLTGRDPQRIEETWQLCYQNSYWRNSPVLNNAISGVDQALWDIKGKIANMPVYQLLGGKVREAAALYRHADGRDPQEVLDNVLRLKEEGYRHIRCQMGGYGGIGKQQTVTGSYNNVAVYGGVGRPQRGLERRTARRLFRPRCLRLSVSPKCSSMCAARSASTPNLLHDVHERLATRSMQCGWPRRWNPIGSSSSKTRWHPEDQEWFKVIRQHAATPIAMGELFTHPLEWKPLIVNQLIDFIRVHISDIGGITPARKLAALCESFGVRTAFHGPGDVSPIGHAANVHLDVVVPNFGIQEFSGFDDALEEVFPGCPQVRNGFLYPNDRPGLGIDIDETLAARYPIHPNMAQFKDGVVDWTQSRLPDGTLWRP